MKKIYFSILLLSISIMCFAQEKWRQKNARVNFTTTPQLEVMKVAGSFSPVASLNASITLDNTYFVGGYLAKKVLRTYSEFPVAPGVKYDANFQHGGVEFMYSMKLGLYRTEGGHYVRRKMRITYNLRLGVGLVWLDDENKSRASESDYFGFAQPSVGAIWPLNDFMQINTGISFPIILKINKLDTYFTGNDFMLPGAFVAFKINLFR